MDGITNSPIELSQATKENTFNTFISTILKEISFKISNAYFDKTIPATVIGIEGTKYKVQLLGANYFVPCSIDNMVLKITDKVWVTIPSNDFNNKYISGRRA